MVVIPSCARVCTGTNDCRRVRVRVRGTSSVSVSRGRGRGRGRGSGSGRGSGRYAAVCGLRHLRRGLTVVGVAAARYAKLEAQEARLRDEYPRLQAALESAKNAMAAARTTLRELRARRHALPPANPDEAKLIDEIADAEGVFNFASADVADRRSAVARNSEQLQLVQSRIAAMKGALLA